MKNYKNFHYEYDRQLTATRENRNNKIWNIFLNGKENEENSII
jgi:hypothetical protein